MKFEQIALDPQAMELAEVAQNRVVDNVDLGRVTDADRHDDLFQPANEPF